MGCGCDSPFVEKRVVAEKNRTLPRKEDSPEHCDANTSSSPNPMQSRRALKLLMVVMALAVRCIDVKARSD